MKSSPFFTWGWFSEPHGYDFNGHLFRRTEGNLCIDPVPPTDACLAEIARMNAVNILLTNRNHSRAANLMRARTGRQDAHSPGRLHDAKVWLTVLVATFPDV